MTERRGTSQATERVDPPAGCLAGRPGGPAGAAVLLYAGLAYLAFLLVTLYSAGFLAGAVVPKDIDDGPVWPWPAAVAADAGLLALFAAQHTVMARRWFKRALTRVCTWPAGRSRSPPPS